MQASEGIAPASSGQNFSSDRSTYSTAPSGSHDHHHHHNHSDNHNRPAESSPDTDDHSIPSDIVDLNRMVTATSRRTTLPPLPDLRFEQSYLASIRGADSWGRVAWITIRDQVLLPLVQGALWTLALSGWRYWNRGASLSGRTLGSRIRSWWYDVNNWKLPPRFMQDARFAGRAQEVNEVGLLGDANHGALGQRKRHRD